MCMIDLHFNQSLATGYHSGSQISRVVTEDWVARNMFCPVCGAPVLGHYEANKPVADFFCDDCKSDFELKSKESKTATIGHKIADITKAEDTQTCFACGESVIEPLPFLDNDI